MIECDNQAAKAIVEAALVLKIHAPFRGLIVKHGLNTIGAIIFNNYADDDVHFTCVMSEPIGMRDARFVARYVFKQLGCRRCTAITSERNLAAQRALLQLGFKIEGCLRQRYADSDGLLFGLLRSEQRITRI